MATIEDVAKAANVSMSTVSYVLSGKRTISADTRLRVEQAIRKLGYRPHAGARALAMSKTHIIGLVAPLRAGVDVNVILQFVAGIATRARERDHDVLLLTQDDADSIARAAQSSMVDALVVMDVESDDPRLETLESVRQPVVLIGLPHDPRGLSCIDLDFEKVGQRAAEHLIEGGHRRIALIGAPEEVRKRHTSYADRMLHGLSTACRAADAEWTYQPTPSSGSGAAASVDAVLKRMPEVTALMVHNEVALPHVISHLQTLGLRVPEDISLIALAPGSVIDALARPVTGIDLPAERIGRLAVDTVLGDDDAEVRLLQPVLTDRGTTRHLT